MWLRDPVTIEVSRSASTPIGVQFWDDFADAPLDITGFSAFDLRVAKADGEIATDIFDVNVYDFKLGLIDFVFDGSAFAGEPGEKEIVIYSYQLRATDPNGVRVIAMRGPLMVTPGIE